MVGKVSTEFTKVEFDVKSRTRALATQLNYFNQVKITETWMEILKYKAVSWR